MVDFGGYSDPDSEKATAQITAPNRQPSTMVHSAQPWFSLTALMPGSPAPSATDQPNSEVHFGTSDGGISDGPTPSKCASGTVQSTNNTRASLLFFHIQHCSGTALWDVATANNECAPRACNMKSGECLVSLNEQTEIDTLQRNGYSYISYETMLPRAFPMPFRSPRSRQLFFSVISMRHPIVRRSPTIASMHPNRHFSSVLLLTAEGSMVISLSRVPIVRSG